MTQLKTTIPLGIILLISPFQFVNGHSLTTVVCFGQNNNGEGYIPLIEQGKIWRYTAGFQKGPSPKNLTRWCEDFYCKLDGEETIDGVIYTKGWFYKVDEDLPINGVPAFYIHEDVDMQQVTAIYNHSFDFGHSEFNSINFLRMDMFNDMDLHKPVLVYDFMTPENSAMHHACTIEIEAGLIKAIQGVGYVSTLDQPSYPADIVMPYLTPTYITGYSEIGPMMFLYAVDSPSRGRIYYHPGFDYQKFADVNTINAETAAEAPVEYYNLQGVRVDNPAAGQLLIRRQGNKVDKVIL